MSFAITQRPEANNLKMWMDEHGFDAKTMIARLGYASPVMIYDARYGLRGAPSRRFLARFDKAFGEAETESAFPGARARVAIRKGERS